MRLLQKVHFFLLTNISRGLNLEVLNSLPFSELPAFSLQEHFQNVPKNLVSQKDYWKRKINSKHLLSLWSCISLQQLRSVSTLHC